MYSSIMAREQQIQHVHSGNLPSKLNHSSLFPCYNMIVYNLNHSNIAESSWSDEGVTTEVTSEDEEKGTFDVICRSSHLTSFAVLLDVNNALSVSTKNQLYRVR